MSKPRCKFALPLTGEHGPWRECSHPVRGGRCRKTVECQSCQFHEPLKPKPDAPEDLPPDECVHRQEITAGEAAAAGLNPQKRWGLCTLPAQPLGKYVCPCTGCGPKCPGYPTNA